MRRLLMKSFLKQQKESKRTLQERFEPGSKCELYQSEFQTCRKNKTEGWAYYAEDLKVLVDKAFSSKTKRRG